MAKVKRIFLIVLVVILITGIGVGSIALFGTYSNGTRVGTIVKFSKKGVVIKTWEGELMKGEAAEPFYFSVNRGEDEIIKAIDRAMDYDYPVKLHYKEKFFRFSWIGDTKYFINKVEKIEELD